VKRTKTHTKEEAEQQLLPELPLLNDVTQLAEAEERNRRSIDRYDSSNWVCPGCGEDTVAIFVVCRSCNFYRWSVPPPAVDVDALPPNQPSCSVTSKSSWSCKACTLENDDACLCCQACGASRPSEAGVWTCAVCTFDNPATSSSCEACGEAKPGFSNDQITSSDLTLPDITQSAGQPGRLQSLLPSKKPRLGQPPHVFSTGHIPSSDPTPPDMEPSAAEPGRLQSLLPSKKPCLKEPPHTRAPVRVASLSMVPSSEQDYDEEKAKAITYAGNVLQDTAASDASTTASDGGSAPEELPPDSAAADCQIVPAARQRPPPRGTRLARWSARANAKAKPGRKMKAIKDAPRTESLACARVAVLVMQLSRANRPSVIAGIEGEERRAELARCLQQRLLMECFCIQSSPRRAWQRASVDALA